MLARRFSAIIPSFDTVSVFFNVRDAIRVSVDAGFVGEIVTVTTSEIFDTGTKIQFCGLSSAINTVFEKRALEKIPFSSVVAGERNNRVPLFYVMFFACPVIRDGVVELQIRFLVVSGLDQVSDPVLVSARACPGDRAGVTPVKATPFFEIVNTHRSTVLLVYFAHITEIIRD